MTASKNDIRKKALQKRLGLNYDQLRYAEMFQKAFFKYFDPADIGVLGFYWPLSSEADPRDIVRFFYHHYNGKCSLPVFSDERRVMRFMCWDPDTPLAEGHSGIMMPAASHRVPIDPDTVIVPLVAFNEEGHRLGFGKGNYDATLQNLRQHKTVRTIGLAYEEQKSEELWLVEPHDEKLDFVLTPNHLYRFI